MPRDPRTRSALVQHLRHEVFNLLGHACVSCGATHALEINHLFGRSYQPRRMNIYNRWLRYRREAHAGLVDLRCPECNQAYVPKPLACLQELQEAATNNPF
jgi:5-methylcytosine-specific restriction endonuclease McrA